MIKDSENTIKMIVKNENSIKMNVIKNFKAKKTHVICQNKDTLHFVKGEEYSCIDKKWEKTLRSECVI